MTRARAVVRDHARDHGQPDRAAIFTGLLDGIDNTSPDMLERPSPRPLDHPCNNTLGMVIAVALRWLELGAS